MPSAARLVALNHLDASIIVGTGLGGRIMRYDVVAFMEKKQITEEGCQGCDSEACYSRSTAYA